MEEEQKQCSKGKAWYPKTTEYFAYVRTTGYWQARCRTCLREASRAYDAIHREERRLKSEKYYETHREQANQYARERAKTEHAKELRRASDARNREKISKRTKAYKEAHKEEIKAQKKEYERMHREEIAEKHRRYNTEHREEIKAQQYRYKRSLHGIAVRRAYSEKARNNTKTWRKAHPDYVLVKTLERRARKRNIQGKHTPKQIQEQLRRQKYRCYYAACGYAKFKKVRGKYIYHIEHTFPLSRVVGSDIPANDIGYIVLACPTCNQSKSNKFPWEWEDGGRLL